VELQTPTLIPVAKWLRFYAFVEVNGRFHIDEFFTLFLSETDAMANGRNDSLVTGCD
jgi:hypothetical protein